MCEAPFRRRKPEPLSFLEHPIAARLRYQLSRERADGSWVVTANAHDLAAAELHAERIGGHVRAVDKRSGEPAGEWIEGVQLRRSA